MSEPRRLSIALTRRSSQSVCPPSPRRDHSRNGQPSYRRFVPTEALLPRNWVRGTVCSGKIGQSSQEPVIPSITRIP